MKKPILTRFIFVLGMVALLLGCETPAPTMTPIRAGITRTPTATPTPVPPRVTFVPTAAPSPTTAAADLTLSISPTSDAPPCEAAHHDRQQWHGLWNAAQGCHYDHEHKHNPHEVDDIFGPPGVWFGGGDLSYPWQTFAGANGRYPAWSGAAADLENVAKHENYGWIVRRDIPAHSDPWIRAFRLQYHAVGAPPGTTTRFHSFSLEAEVCAQNGVCGLIRTGGWLDFGNLEVGQYGIVALPGEADAWEDEGRRRIHYFYEDAARRHDEVLRASFFWYGRLRPVTPPYQDNPLEPLLIALATADTWANVDPAAPHESHLFCPDFDCHKNGSTIQAHVVQFENRYTHFEGYTDRYGKTAVGCVTVGLDCIPLMIENAPIGRVQHRDDRDLGLSEAGMQDFDTSPPGVWWIEYPN